MGEHKKDFSEELVCDAKDLVIGEPAMIQQGAKVFEAVEVILEDPRTQTIYVVDSKKRLQGIITINDLLKVSSIQMGAHKRTKFINFFKYMNMLYSETVEDIMRKPIYTRNAEKIMTALERMERHNLADIPVIDKDRVIVGELNGLEILTVIHDKIQSGDVEKFL